MPARKSCAPASSQPVLSNMHAPEKKMKGPIKDMGMALAPAKARPARTGGDLFIVDNSDGDWKVAHYLSEWCDIARALDIATGYFEIGSLLALDGQWQKLDQIRILMGSEVSLRTRQAFASMLDGLTGALDLSLEREKDKNDFLTGAPAIVEALRSGKMACKVYRERKFHAKAYITHARFEVVGPTALVGSSNFTYPGLHDNVELNVQLRTGVEDLQAWYERHWDEAEDVTPDILKVIERHVREHTPFEVYAKSLYEFFKGHELTASEWELTESRMYPVLDEYQREGYHALMKIAERHHGALLCDAVGLGKTFIGMMVIERLLRDRKNVALIVPKAARKPVWESKLNRYLPGSIKSRFGNNLVVYNHTDLLRGGEFTDLMKEVQERADAVIIDEAHHFRNQASKRYRKLFDMLDGKQLFLLTATPINNSLLDLQHLIELFSRRQADYFAAAPLGIHSLVGHFRTLESALEHLTGQPNGEVEMTMAEAEQVLNKDPLAQTLVVQRSRAYARKSQEQNGGSWVVFPRREPPRVGKYSLRKTYGGLLDHLKQAFFRVGKPPLLSLAMYYPLNYLKVVTESPEVLWNKGRQMQVVGLIRTQLLKRFESSATSFEATCQRLLLRLLAFVEVNVETAAEERRRDRWKAQQADLLERIKAQLAYGDEEDAEDDVVPAEFLEAAETLPRAEYKVDEILNETYGDLEQLVIFLGDLKGLSAANDDKLQTLLNLLTTDPLLSRHKVLIFSEYMETARYVYDELKKAGIGPLDVVHSGLDRDRGQIITAFSPYYNDSSSADLKAKGWPETRVLISTDVLSEGLNLQDATLLINYDLHWNPVRLMQRIGRVDRRLAPDTEAQLAADHPEVADLRGKVRYWNFLPPNELDDLLGLYERVAHKVLRISKVFGIEGKQLLRPDDDFEALKEFNQAYEGAPSAIEAMRLAYRDLLKAHPGLEEQLAAMPLRVFSGREHPTASVKAVFFCYALPAKATVTGEWTDEAGYAQWYLYDVATEKILEDAEQIEAVIRSEPDTPRRVEMDQTLLADIRKKIEKHITHTYLKPTQAPMGVKPALKAWLELN